MNLRYFVVIDDSGDRDSTKMQNALQNHFLPEKVAFGKNMVT
jgi:hypothetical protein